MLRFVLGTFSALLAATSLATTPGVDSRAGDADRATIHPALTSQYVIAPSRDAEKAGPTRTVTPTNVAVSNASVRRYRTLADYPDYNRGFYGSGIVVPEGGKAPRSDAAIGIETGRILAGGCAPSNPDDLSSPCGSQMKERERWTFRMSYIDPTNPNAAEINVGFPGLFGMRGDDVYVWERQTTGGHSCFTFYECDKYGVNLNELTATVRGFQPDCSNRTGAGYRAYIYYQYSLYKTGAAIPPGASEWLPATVPATTTRLEQPGKEIFSQVATEPTHRSWALAIGENAITISGGGLVHPSVPSTGYTGVHDPLNLAIESIPGGSETISVSAYDCVALPNIAFSIAREFVESGAHSAHSSAPPPLDSVSTLDNYTGTTDANGQWSTTLHAGTVGETIKYTLTATVQGEPFVAHSLDVSTAFVAMVDPGANDPNIRYTGNTSSVGLRHPSNHNASSELHAFVRDLAAQYNARIVNTPPRQPGGYVWPQGSLGLNDMSVATGGVFDINANWVPPHHQHSFGVACDIDHCIQVANGQCGDIDYETTLKKVAKDLGGFLLIESTNSDNLHVQIAEELISDVLLKETR